MLALLLSLNISFAVTAQYARQKNLPYQWTFPTTKNNSQNFSNQNIRRVQETIKNSSNSPYLSIEERLVSFVRKMVKTLNFTTYKLGGTRFDLSRGIYIVDCSSYVDHVLRRITPRAYSSVVNFSESQKPTTHDYYHFFSKLPSGSKNYWASIEDVKKLRPGDIMVFRYKNKLHRQTQGHIMIVMERPVQEKNIFKIKIADSAPHRHSHDTRDSRDSGIGIGTLLLKVNPKTFQPSAYAWRIGSSWKKNVNFAMARPFDIGS